ncbi:hypothetical protein Pla52n_56870 [Stieleria varia]|uniref:Uncharacterized protein n=1 Tax=Stieleria varia TaxID=2528005 RepID=A0A5C6A2T5_9BACT|nr:hypothetical protein Pla52n_56870 [Stieleria varia]
MCNGRERILNRWRSGLRQKSDPQGKSGESNYQVRLQTYRCSQGQTGAADQFLYSCFRSSPRFFTSSMIFALLSLSRSGHWNFGDADGS